MEKSKFRQIVFKCLYPTSKSVSNEERSIRILLIRSILEYKSTHCVHVMAHTLGYSRKTPAWTAKETKALIKGEAVRSPILDSAKRARVLDAQYGLTYKRWGTRWACWYSRKNPSIRGHGETRYLALKNLKAKTKK